jgi:hypothetical protein
MAGLVECLLRPVQSLLRFQVARRSRLRLQSLLCVGNRLRNPNLAKCDIDLVPDIVAHGDALMPRHLIEQHKLPADFLVQLLKPLLLFLDLPTDPELI